VWYAPRMASIEQSLTGRSEAERLREDWDRMDGEPSASFVRFLVYRDQGPDRSVVKTAEACGVSRKSAERWASRWSWVKRAVAYDNWLIELGESLNNATRLRHRRSAVRFGSVSLDKAIRSVTRLNETKLDVSDIVQLARTGDEIGRRALMIPSGEVKPTVAPASVSFGFVLDQRSANLTPGWLSQADANQAKLNQAESSEVQRKVLESNMAAAPAGPIPELLVPCPDGNDAKVTLSDRIVDVATGNK